MTSEAFLSGLQKMNTNAASKHEEYERACEQIRKDNVELLKEFVDWMRSQGASDRTVGTHLPNASFYIQMFLLYEQPLRPHAGVSSISMYLGYWFIRKGPIATPGTVKSTATSLVRFYSFLQEKGLVSAEQVDQMRQTIKTQMHHWQERARRYNNPDITDQSKIWI
jgi:hypothetical protein